MSLMQEFAVLIAIDLWEPSEREASIGRLRSLASLSVHHTPAAAASLSLARYSLAGKNEPPGSFLRLQHSANILLYLTTVQSDFLLHAAYSKVASILALDGTKIPGIPC